MNRWGIDLLKSRSQLYVVPLIALILLGFLYGLSDTHATLTFEKTWGLGDSDIAQSVSLDNSGNIYVTGYTSSFTSSGIHVFLLKYDSSGNLVWQRMWGGSGSEFGRGVGVDSLGNIYVTGYTSSFGAGGNDVFLLKWGSSGSLVWQKTWGGTGDELGLGLAVNSSNGIYVTGYSTSTLSANPQVILLRFDSSGDLIWQRSWGGSGTNYGQSVTVDSSGGVYLTGFTTSTGAGGQDVLVLKFDSSGGLIWQRTWGGKGDEEGYSIAADSSRNVYVAGATQSTGAGNDDALILKLSSAGSLLWEKTWGGADTDQAQGVTVDGLGYVYVTGFTSSFGGAAGHVFLMSLSFAGSLLWETLWGGINGMDQGLGVAAAGSGYAVTAGFVSESSPYSTSTLSAPLATPTISLSTPTTSASTPSLNTGTPSGIVTTITGSEMYRDKQDAFLFKFGSPTAPTPPSGLTATSGQRFVNLTWSVPAFNGFNSITNYKVYRGTTSGGESPLATIGNQTKYTDQSVAGGVTYYYTVTAINAIGESGFSNEASPPTPPTTPPTPPQGLTATASTGDVALNWAAPSSNGGASITAYNLYRGITSGNEILLTTLATQTFYNDTNVAGGTTYYYKVTAVNIVGESASSNEVSAMPVSSPTPPQKLQAISSLGAIILSWSPPSSNGGSAIQGYEVWRGTSAGTETLLANLPNQLSYSDIPLPAGTTFFYIVRADNAIGSSGFSNEVNAVPSSTPTGPSAPLNLVATGGKNEITLTWSPSLSNGGLSIIGYNIYRSTGTGNETLTDALVANQTVFTDNDTNLKVGVTYYYKVTAVDSALNEGPPSNEANATPFTTPSAPQNLQAFNGRNEIALTWMAPSSNGFSPISGYRIYRNSTLLTAIGNTTSYIDTSVAAGPFYYYNVSALNAAGEGPHSLQASAFASSGPIAPSPPQNLVATAQKGNITLTWTAPLSDGGSSITGYEIWNGTSPGSESRLVSIGTQTSYVVIGLQGGTPYYYYVKAVNGVGVSLPSNEAHATPTSPPTKPLSLLASGGPGRVTLTWATPSSNGGLAIAGYKIYRSISPGLETFVANITNGNQFSYVDLSVTPGTTYYYKVTAFNALGESSLSNEASATPSTPATPPGAPTGLTLTSTATNITLTWSPPSSNGGSPITSYQIYRGTASGSETFLNTTGNVLSYVDSAVIPGTTYYYYVRAVNSAGIGAQSTEMSIALAPPQTSPSQPQNLQATAEINSVNLTWSPPASNGGSAITGYLIFRGTSTGSETLYQSITNVTTYLDQTVTSGTTYYYKIKAVNDVGQSDFSNEATAKPLAPTAPPAFPIIPVAIAALVIVAVGALGVIFWRRRVSQRLMMPP